MTEVSVNVSDASSGLRSVKLASDVWELNVHATDAAWATLAGIDGTDWSERRVLQVGTSATAAVFWCAAGDDVSVAIGTDDEAWDIAFLVPRTVIDAILRACGGGD